VKRIVLVMPLVLAIGCQSSGPDGQRSFAEAPPDDDPYESQQGTQLLGFTDPHVSYFKFGGGLTHGRVIKGQVGTDQAEGRQLIGVPLQAVRFDGSTIDMRIAGIIDPTDDADQWHYELLARDPLTGSWDKACAEPPGLYPGKPVGQLAIAMPGSWQANGTYAMDDSRFVFSCASGVAAKCTSWGYAATNTLRGDTIDGDWSVVSGPDLIQACTRLARADYCSNGVSRTVDGTKIHVYDIFGGPVRPEQKVPGFLFEAAWMGSAWKTSDGGPEPRPAMCLSKLRWATLPLGGDCPLQLPDPRVKGEGRYCEDIDPRDLERQGAFFYNDSPVIDAGLFTWVNDRQDSWLSTTHLYPQPAGIAPEPFGTALTPPPEVQLPERQPHFEGALFRYEATPPPGTVLLSTWYCADVPGEPKRGGDFLTSTRTPDGCEKIGDEGWLYGPDTQVPAGAPNRVPLRRWERKVQNWDAGGITVRRSLTSTSDSAAFRAQGWQQVAFEGWLPR
jgi:hypothetical protein